ncbi:hypothetical protein DYU05_04640 [Mucilaginibacter terrenus]|uniref:histidine kinase n=1 Tax=Mucilaginibacter terrenus TaxID=2482727 RepID=A0A3E2NVB4_9SPHI|nr:hypothetical protein [Mucilaginibacter terrenus]RFZ84897.1 hypothetical protein DYU05_04640 [Mucilaginibacter terrenus]
MNAHLYRLLLLPAGIILLLSCREKPRLPTESTKTSASIEALVSRGERLENADADSLLEISKKLLALGQQNGIGKAKVYGRLFKAHYLWMASRHPQAMDEAIKCLADVERYNIKAVYPELYGLISNLHKENANYKMALVAQQKGLHWAVVNADTAKIIGLLSLKAMLIHNKRKVFLVDTVFADTSLNVQLRALKIAESSPKYEVKRIPLYDNVGQYYLDKNVYDKAILYAGKGIQLSTKHNQQRSLTYGYCWLGQALFYKGDREKGLSYVNKALAIARNLNEPYREMELYKHLYDCYYSVNDYKTALAYIRRSQNMRDSLQVRKNEVQLSELQIKYESAKKDEALALMDKKQAIKNRQLVVTVAGCVLFIVFTIIMFLQYRLISKNNRLTVLSNEKKDKALANIAFIQSHELRKPLASIMGLISVIEISDHIVDKETLEKLGKAGEQLDQSIREIITHVEEEAKA